jgi:hypothetical protein
MQHYKLGPVKLEKARQELERFEAITGRRGMPLTKKGKTIKAAMLKQYGAKKGKQVFYASRTPARSRGGEEAFLSSLMTARAAAMSSSN